MLSSTYGYSFSLLLNTNMKPLLVGLWAICCSSFAAGQQVSNVFFNWNAANSNYPGYMLAETISQEKNGIIWLGGRDGLLRFDGKHFQPFTSQVFDSSTIPGNYIASTHIDGRYMYGGTFSTGFFLMDLATLKVKRISLLGPTTGNKFTVSAIIPHQKDSLWIACSKKQLICVDKNNFKQRPGFKLRSLPGSEVDSGTIFTIQPAQHDPSKLWLITNQSILLASGSTGEYRTFRFSVKKENGQLTDLEKPTSIVEESDSTALVSFFKGGLIKWNFKNNTYRYFQYPLSTPGVTNIAINKIAARADNEYFISTSNSGLYVFNSLNNTFSKNNVKNNSLPDPFSEPTRELFKDKNGGIWISMIGGIAYWHPAYQGVQSFFDNTAARNTVASSVQYYDHNIVITRRDPKVPLAIFDAQSKKWIPAPAGSLKDYYVRRILPYNGGNIYNTMNGQWAIYNKLTMQLQPFQLPTPFLDVQKNINGMDENEQYIVCSAIGGLYIFNKANKTLQFYTGSEKPDSLHTKNTVQVKIDGQQQVWLASVFGLSVYSFQTKKFRELSFRTNKEWQGLRVISDLQLGSNGLIYVATQDDGIYVFDTRTKKLETHYNKEYLLNENFVNSIVLDSSQNYLWASTLSGVNVIDLRHQRSKRWDKHNSGLGLSDGFFGMTVLNNNEVYCSDSVLYHFKMGSFDKINIKPFISGYIADKKYFNGDDLIHIDKDINYIELFISTGFPADPAHAKIQYRLDKNGAWNDADNGKIIIPSLKNGETEIQLKSLLQGVLDGSGENIITIKRGLYFYQTAWFKALALLLLAGAVYFIFKTRIQQVRKQEQEKSLLHNKINELEIASLRSQMNPHFIFNTLSSLRYLVLMGENKKASSFILKLSRLLRGILAHSGEATIALTDELGALQLYLEIEALRFDNDFSYSIHTDEEIDVFDIKIPPMLLQPFVENAIKHGLVNSGLEDKWVTIEVKKGLENEVKFIITDNGIGRENAQRLHANSKHHSFGTHITNQRVELFNKTSGASISCKIFDYSSDKNNPGTVVEMLYRYLAADV